MKQKRKVKSLLPQRKDKKTSFLTTLLLVLSTILCIGSASLLTSSVFAENVTEVTFTGLSDNMEAVYNLKFVNPENLSGDGVADVYFHDNSLYISPSSVIVSGSSRVNEVESGVYSHILGGENNTIYSDNVTIIAGKHNIVMSGGANSTILGGMDNELGTGAVLIGGNSNQVSNSKKGVVLIGGINNHVIENNTNRNIFILGGENNNVNTTGENMIIGGASVNINGADINNIFTFSSPKPFTPMSGKTFYLNMENGVGIGTSGVPGGLAVKGAIGLSNQEDQRFCNSGNLGVIYSLNGCLIGCTKTSLKKQAESDDAPFELLSLNEKCKDKLSGYINAGDVFYQEEEIPETPSYTGYCTHVNFTGHTVPCSTPSVYQNVIFETSIVDYGECTDFLIKNGENKCVFACEKGYHLGYDNDSTYGGFGTGCYADCRLGSDNELPLRHNQTGTLYDVTTVRCSDGEQCKTCGSHAKNVICKNGTVMEYSGGTIGGVIDTSSYKYSECTLRGGYDCPSNGYNITGSTKLKQYFVGGDNMGQVNLWHHVTGALTEDEIEMIRTAQSMGVGLGPKKQNNTIITPNINTIINPKDMEIRESPRWQNVNRSIITSTSTGARGIYQLCKYYNNYKDSPDREGVYKNPNTDCGTPINLYKLIDCTPGYTFTGGTCRPKCDSFLSGDSKTYTYGTVLTGYKEGSVSCPNKNCEYAAFKCVDDGGLTGAWEPIAGFAGKKPEAYKYERCDVNTKTCGEGFVLQAGDLERFKNTDFTGYQNSIYTGCTIIERNNGNCETGSTYYKLDGCKRNYHTENNEYCIYNYRSEPCPDKPDNAARVHESPRERNHITLVPGQYGQSWDEDAWSSDIQPPDACKWKCIDGYSYNKTTKKCEKNECYGEEPSNAIFIEGSDQNLTGRVKRTLYASKSEATGKQCAYICNYDQGYVYDSIEKKCVSISDYCGENPYECASPLSEYNTGEIEGGYIWDCYYDGEKFKSCHKCKEELGYYEYDLNQNKCIRHIECAGELPQNSIINNNVPNDEYNIVYHYSENKNEACSFSCKTGSVFHNGMCDDGQSTCGEGGCKCIKQDLSGNLYPWIANSAYVIEEYSKPIINELGQVLPYLNGQVFTDAMKWEPRPGDIILTYPKNAPFYYVGSGNIRYKITANFPNNNSYGTVIRADKIRSALSAGNRVDWSGNYYEWKESYSYRILRTEISTKFRQGYSAFYSNRTSCPEWSNLPLGTKIDNRFKESKFYYVCSGLNRCEVTLNSENEVNQVTIKGSACKNDIDPSCKPETSGQGGSGNGGGNGGGNTQTNPITVTVKVINNNLNNILEALNINLKDQNNNETTIGIGCQVPKNGENTCVFNNIENRWMGSRISFDAIYRGSSTKVTPSGTNDYQIDSLNPNFEITFK